VSAHQAAKHGPIATAVSAALLTNILLSYSKTMIGKAGFILENKWAR
jgi:hypothetical protein